MDGNLFALFFVVCAIGLTAIVVLLYTLSQHRKTLNELEGEWRKSDILLETVWQQHELLRQHNIIVVHKKEVEKWVQFYRNRKSV